MAYTTINKHTEHFNTKLFTGNGSTTQAITGVGFQPDLFWIKCRNETADNQLSDVLRGKSGSLYYQLQSNGTGLHVVQGDNDGVHSLDSDGFTVGHTNSVAWNKNNNTYATWNWKAGGAGSANTDGATASTVSVNNTAGFSIVKWTGTSGNTTVGHGMNTAPVFTLVKNYGSSGMNWIVYHKGISPDYAIKLNTTDAQSNSNNYWQSTAPTNSVLTFTGNTASNSNGNGMIAYCFAEKTGYSKTLKWASNNNSNGVFLYTGFAPSFFIFKAYDTNRGWNLVDNKRLGYNVIDKVINPNLSIAESDTNGIVDFLSNGIKFRTDGSDFAGTYNFIGFAIGQSLVGSNNIPCTAR